jgi:carbon-monoxide dehydrogenase medium subunit
LKPYPFRYLAPHSLAEAIEMLDEHGSQASLLAGGQSLIASMNFRCLRPAVLIDINRIPELAYIQEDDMAIRIGAMTRQRTIEFHPLIQQRVPLIHAAVPHIAHPVIRNRGTIGGSLSFADPAAELATVTLALGARYKAASTRGERWIEASHFFTGMYRQALEPDEMLVEVEVPIPPDPTSWAFQEIARRQGDRVLMGVAAVIDLDEEGRCREARLVYQNAAPTPVLAQKASRVLTGNPPSRDLFRQVAEIASTDEIQPVPDVHATGEFRRHLARELTLRVLDTAFSRARAEPNTHDGHSPGKSTA